MQSIVWAQLLRQFPPEHYGNLLVVTAAGTEIAVQNILRLDHEFVALRGRMAGSADGNRLFFVPYAQIGYLASQTAWTEADYRSCFDSLTFDAPAGAEAVASTPSESEPDPSTAEPAADAPAAKAAPIKSAVLERFRSRSAMLAGVKLNLSQPPDS